MCLTLHEKSLVIEELNNGQGVTYLAKKYGVAKSTICKIKQKKNMISEAVRDTNIRPGKRRTLKSSEFPKMEKQLYDWFLSQREKNGIVSGEIIKQEAKQIHSQIKENDKQFTASEGWLQRFKKRFGIRFLKSAKEKLSSPSEPVDPFKLQLKSKIEELYDVYNANEMGLYWKLLADKTFVSATEEATAGFKCHWDESATSKSLELLRMLTPQASLQEGDVLGWEQCDNEFKTDIEECPNDKTIENNSEHLNKVSLDSAINALNVVTQWAEESEVDIMDLIVIKRIREKAIMPKRKSSQKQTKISDFFAKKR